MSRSNDNNRRRDHEAQALDALVAAALHAEGDATMSEMSVEKLQAAKSLLTTKDKAALGISDARYVRRLVEERLRDRASRPRSPETHQKPDLSISKNPGQRNGVLVMKSVVIATLVAAVLVVGFFVSVRMQDDGLGGADERVSASQQSRLSQLEDRLAAVDGLREEVKTLADLVARLEARTGEGTDERTPALGGTRGATSSSPQRESVDEEVIEAVTELLKTPRGQEEFDSVVEASVRRYQQQERQKRQLRTAEIKEEIEEFRQGPYGKYNLKVNSMAKWLDLNDYQKGVYHTQVAHYDAQIQDARTREKEDPENRDKYRQERQDLRQGFVSIFANSLQPEQVEIFNAMSDYEKRPDGDERTMARVIYGREARSDREGEPHGEMLQPRATPRRARSRK